jgi:hypothetical protein
MAGKEIKLCQYCGGPITGKGKKYCSCSCAARATNQKRRGFDNLPWVKVNDREYQCIFNTGVVCQDRECATCGWNPIVAEARTRARESK